MFKVSGTRTFYHYKSHASLGVDSSSSVDIFFTTFSSVCRPKTLSHFTLITGKWYRFGFKSALLSKIVSGPHSVNTKSLLALVRANGVGVSTR